MKIPWVNTLNTERPSKTFTYMRANEVYQNAHVDRTLSSFPTSCPKCYGDCLDRLAGCGCTLETKGRFAYKRGGLLTRDFLSDLKKVREV